jgi:hypothetical protein
MTGADESPCPRGRVTGTGPPGGEVSEASFGVR